MAPTFLQLAIPQLAESGRSTLRKCCACHEICTRPRESAAPATKSILDFAKVLHLPRNSNLAKPSRGRANGPVSETVPRPFRDRSGTVPRPPPYRRRDRGGLRTVRKPNSRMAPTFLQLAIPQLAESGRSALRKCCACHEICTRPRESAAPATKSILDLAKVLHLPRNSILAKPSRGRANGPVSETVPRPFRDRSGTVPRPPPYRRRDRGGLRTVRKPNSRMAPTFLQLAIPQLAESGRSTLRKCCACHEICTRPRESAAPATKSILDLAKVLRLPRNSNLAKPSRGRANGPVSETVPRPFRDRSGTVPRPPPYRRRDRRTGVATEVVCALSGSPIHAWHQRFCNLLSPSSQKVDAAPCESDAPATKSVLDLAKVLRLPRNLYLTLRKCCTCHAIQT